MTTGYVNIGDALDNETYTTVTTTAQTYPDDIWYEIKKWNMPITPEWSGSSAYMARKVYKYCLMHTQFR